MIAGGEFMDSDPGSRNLHKQKYNSRGSLVQATNKIPR
jgi:hypothetical protein